MAKNQMASATKNPAASTSMRTHLSPLSAVKIVRAAPADRRYPCSQAPPTCLYVRATKVATADVVDGAVRQTCTVPRR